MVIEDLFADLASGEPLGADFGDAGRVCFLLPAAALRARRFEDGWVVLQCH